MTRVLGAASVEPLAVSLMPAMDLSENVRKNGKGQKFPLGRVYRACFILCGERDRHVWSAAAASGCNGTLTEAG